MAEYLLAPQYPGPVPIQKIGQRYLHDAEGRNLSEYPRKGLFYAHHINSLLSVL